MFGNILIDKIRFSKKKDLIFDPFEVQRELDLILKQHFRKDNYKVKFDNNYFRITFTPTLYLDNVVESENNHILNLEMIDETKFLKLLKQIYNVIGECNVTWIDITKNVLVEMLATSYIKALSKRIIKYPYKKMNCTSNVNDVTLTLCPLKRTVCTECYNLNRQITFYAKSNEVKSKSTTRFIDNVFLSEDEIAQLPFENYIKDQHRLYLKGLNIVRCEQRYKYTVNIKRITQYLLDSKEQSNLDISLLIELLENGTLYQKLEDFYNLQLKQYIFYDDFRNKKPSSSKFLPMIKDLLEEFDDNEEIDLTDYQYMFHEIKYDDKFTRAMKEIQFYSIGNYYNELYDKLKL